jgi:hypothetical protein
MTTFYPPIRLHEKRGEIKEGKEKMTKGREEKGENRSRI